MHNGATMVCYDNACGSESCSSCGPETTTDWNRVIPRSAAEVLGSLFPTTRTINISEMMITFLVDVATSVRFSETGQKACSDVYRQYQKIMVTKGPVEVILIPRYCDYSPNSNDSIYMTDLMTSCVCLYKIWCDSKTTMVLYKFQTNCKGYLKVTILQPNEILPIT